MADEEVGGDLPDILNRLGFPFQNCQSAYDNIQRSFGEVGNAGGVVYFLPFLFHERAAEGVMAGHVLDEEAGSPEFEAVGGRLGVMDEHFLQLGAVVARQAQGLI